MSMGLAAKARHLPVLPGRPGRTRLDGLLAPPHAPGSVISSGPASRGMISPRLTYRMLDGISNAMAGRDRPRLGEPAVESRREPRLLKGRTGLRELVGEVEDA